MFPVLAVGRILGHTLRASIQALTNVALGQLTEERASRYLAQWGQSIIADAGLQLDVRGSERVDWTRAYVVMSNHQSNLDPPLIAGVVPGPVRFVTKAELRKVPVWGKAMAVAGMIFIDRGDRAQATASLATAGEAIARGINIWIAPEGTRTRTGELGAMKKGGFMLALANGTPIVPMAISGTRNALPHGAINLKQGERVRVEFGAPIAVKGRERDEIIAEVRQFFVDKVVAAP